MVILVLKILYSIEFNKKVENRLMKGSQNIKSQDSHKSVKENTI